MKHFIEIRLENNKEIKKWRAQLKAVVNNETIKIEDFGFVFDDENAALEHTYNRLRLSRGWILYIITDDFVKNGKEWSCRFRKDKEFQLVKWIKSIKLKKDFTSKSWTAKGSSKKYFKNLRKCKIF